MKLMKEPGDRAVNNIWEQTSLLERIIMDACDLCMGLDALPDMPSVEDWPIQKVVVFLVDSKRKNCYLQHSFITQGVWSLIEKAIGDSNHSSECKLGQGCVEKEEKSAKCRQGHEAKESEIVFKKLALSAVKEATGVKRGVIILERHVAYSLGKERTTARLYIMQCTSENNGLRTVPIEDVINSLEGPLFENSSSLWTITPVVEYFHILPFANILSDWFSRHVCYFFISQPFPSDISFSFLKVQPDPKVSQRIIDQREIGVRKRKILAEESQTVPIKACSNRMPDSVAVSSHNSNLNLDKLQAVIVSKAKLLSEAALKVLLCKRDKLILQHRNIEDEIAKFDKSIQTIMEGGEGNWELKRDLISESCNDSCPRRTARKANFQHLPDNLMLECDERIKLSDPFPRTRNPCQELDDLCYDNNWLLPTYHVSPSDDGYKAKVRLKDMRSMHKACGFPRPNPQEARESAASALLNELHSPQSLD